MPSVKRSARSSSGISSIVRRPRRRRSAAFGIVWSESQLATDVARIPWERPRRNSDGISRIVRVIGATVTAVRTPMAVVRVTSRTGLVPAGFGSSAR